MADPRKPVLGALKAIQTASKAADEELAAGKLKAALEAQQAPMTRPQGTGLPLMPRDQGMYTPREQKDLPRMPTVDKARAAGKSPKYNERTQDLLDSRKARGKVDDLINKGKALDVKEWYGTEPLRQVAMDAGRTPEQFESLMAQLASASQRNPVDKQNQMGSYLYHLSETGQLPADSLLLTNKLKKALKEDPSLAEGRTLIELPKGYGSLAQGDIFNRAVMIGQGNIGEALPPNKKLGTFYENLLGNLKPVTVDVNALRGPIIEQGDPRWLASKLVEKDDKGKVINSYKPREMFDTGEMTMREAKQRPGFWEAAPKGSEYAGFEELWQRGAKRHNIEPAEAQALGWYGSADVTALKTKPENYVDNLERLIKRTAEQTGKSPTEVMNDMVTGKGFLRKDGGAVNRKESPADMARFQKRFAMHKAIGGRVQSKPVKMASGGRASIFDAPKMANGGATRVPPKKTEGFVEEAPKSKSIFDTVRQAVRQAPKVVTSPLGVGLNAGYAGYKFLTGEDPLEDLRKKLDAKLNPPIDTGSAPVQQFEPLEKARGGLTRMAEGGESIDKSLKKMQNYSVSDQGAKKPNELSGVVLAGASWLAGDEKTKLAKQAFGEDVTNTAIGGQKTSDVLNQLNIFQRDGGTFAPNTTVVLDIGANDIAQGVDEATIRANLNEIVSRLGDEGVQVILSGQPEAHSYEEAINRTDLQMDDLYQDIAASNPNVVLVDAMSDFLNQKDLMDESRFHLSSDDSKLAYLNKFADAYKGLEAGNQEVTSAPPQAQVQQLADPIKQDFQTAISQAEEPVVDQRVTDPIKQEFQEVIGQTEIPAVNYDPPEIREVERQPSAGYMSAQQNQGLDTYYQDINKYVAENHTPEEIQQAMEYYGVSQADVDAARDYQPSGAGRFEESYATEQYKRGGAVGQESPADMARFKKRLVMHKALGGAVKKPQKFDGGGIAAADVGSNTEDKGPTKAGLMAEFLAKMAKDQGKEELESLKKPRAITDLLNRGVLANNPLSAGVDLFNLGLGAVGMGSEKPFLGSEHMKDLMNKTGVTSGEERPMMETALSFVSPTAVIKGGMKATEAAKKAPELLNKASSAITSSKLSPLATEAKTASAGKPTGATYATKQEGPFFRVSPTTLDTSKAKNRGIREADELQGQAPLGGGAGQTGSQVPTRLADEEVARIIADPVANEPLNIAKKYTQETQGTDFVLPEMPESSLVKQSAIGRTHQLAVEGSPEYKTAVFDAYAQQMPDVLEQAGAKNYDDLMEKAYRQLAKETDAQFQALPYNFSYHRAGEGNYNSSKEMSADVHGNKHLYVFQGGDPHDFLNRVDPASGLNENEKFRAVHDLLGHAIYGNQFGPKGEETAWAIHSQMYSPLARLAMTAETRGQNSMVNYSPLNANLKAEIAKFDSLADEARRRGDKALLNEINAAKRQAYSGFQFAPQKAVLLPPEFLSTQYAGGMPDYLQAANRPVKGTETQSVLTHFSNQPDLQMLDPKKYGSGIKGAEAERLREYPGAVKDRSYFYLGEPGTVAPEPGLGVNRYRGEASSLYDITQDPLNFQRLARESNRTPFTAKYNQGMTYPLQDANDVERLVKEYGYQGMANPKATKPMAIMFKETPVRRQARGGLTLMK
jgi:hypothetical protein